MQAALLGTLGPLVLLTACASAGPATGGTGPRVTTVVTPAAEPAQPTRTRQHPQVTPARPAARIRMTVREWQYVDAVMDNTVDIASVEGPRSDVVRGSAVREAGWSQVIRGGAWPPEREVVAVTLPVASWRFVARELERWAAVEDDLPELQDGGDELRRVRGLIVRQLRSRG